MPLQEEATPVDERDLIAQTAGGSRDALAALFELHSAHVYRIAFRLTMSADEADDVVQELFIGLPEALATYAASGDFAAWLGKVAVRTTLMKMRADKRRAATALRAGSDAATAMSNFLLDRMAITTALIALPSDLRVVFMLRDIEGYSHAEIAALLGIRPGTAEVRLHRARRRLRALLGDR
jgi:RNA polymerase sigma-70 factor (ECF subfamily)